MTSAAEREEWTLVTGSSQASLLFGVAVAEDAPITRWQQRIVDELRGAGAQDVAYYTVAVSARRDRRRPMRRAQRQVRLLQPDANSGGVAWQPWRGRHTADLDFVMCLVDGDDCPTLGAGTRFGSWSFSPGLAPAADILDQFLAGQRLVTVGLYRNGPAQQPALIHEGVFRCEPRSFSETLASIVTAVADWPVRAARAAVSGGPEVAASAAGDISQPRQGSPRAAAIRTLRAWTQALVRRDVWNIGVAQWCGLDPEHRVVALQPKWFPDPPYGRFLADPFPVRGGADSATIVAEEFDFASRTGRLVTGRWDSTRGGVTSWGPAFPLPHHASYPFVVHTPDGTFCVPECLRSREVAAWRLHDDGSWTKAATLVAGRRLVDPTIVEHDGRWWLFATDEDRGSDTNLYGWYAQTFFGPWQPHRLNPLKTDVRSTRSAGPLFSIGNRLVRPAQDCSRTYGGQIVLNELVRLDETSFDERTIATVRIADGSSYPHGPHTLTFLTPNLVMVDGKRTELADVSLAVRRLPRRIVSLARRATRPLTRQPLRW
jgi:hypothetical protein